MSDDTPGIHDLLRELLAWVKFQNRQALVDALQTSLSTSNDRAIYELTDGTRSGAVVAKEVGVSRSAVSQKWKSWRQAALLFDNGGEGPRHLASLESLGGLPTPEV